MTWRIILQLFRICSRRRGTSHQNSFHCIGTTFKKKSMFDLGVKQLDDALEDLHTMDDVKKQVL